MALAHFELRPDQVEDLGALIRNPRHGLWSEPGTGKTPIACLYTWWMWSRQQKRTVWVQPLAIIEKNRDELLNFTEFEREDLRIFSGTPEAVKLLGLLRAVQAGSVYAGGDQNVYVLDEKNKPNKTGATRVGGLIEQRYLTVRITKPIRVKFKGKVEEWVHQFQLTPEGEQFLNSGLIEKQLKLREKVLLMGADAWAENQEWILEHNPDIDLLIGDEWHKMYSTWDSARTQALSRSMKKITRMCPMTGTLIRGRLDSAFSAIHLIEARYYGHIRTFLNRHGVKDEWGKIKSWVGQETVREILRRHGQERLFREVYGDVPVVFQTHYVKMSGAQEAAYREFEAKAILELEKVFLDGTMPGVNLIRSREILSCPEKWGIGKGEMTARDAFFDVQLSNHLQDGSPWMVGSPARSTTRSPTRSTRSRCCSISWTRGKASMRDLSRMGSYDLDKGQLREELAEMVKALEEGRLFPVRVTRSVRDAQGDFQQRTLVMRYHIRSEG